MAVHEGTAKEEGVGRSHLQLKARRQPEEYAPRYRERLREKVGVEHPLQW